MSTSALAPTVQSPQLLNPYIEAINDNKDLMSVATKQARSTKLQAVGLNVATKAMFVFIIVIIGAVLIAAYAAGPLTGWLPFALVGAALATIPISLFMGYLHKQFLKYNGVAMLDAEVLKELKQIAHWNDPEIRTFLREKIKMSDDEINRLPLDALRAKSQDKNNPLRALLPVIARYNYHVNALNEAAKNLKVNVMKARESVADKELLGKYQGAIGDLLEAKLIPSGMNACLMREILRRPFLQLKSFKDIGDYAAENIGDREFAKAVCKVDTYFTFNRDNYVKIFNQEPPPAVALWQLEDKLNPDTNKRIWDSEGEPNSPNGLHEFFFPQAIRA